jgi:hypothetical protein
VRGAVVNDPVDRPGGGVWLAGHDLIDESAERLDPGLGFDAIEQVGVMHVPRGEVRECAAALVLELVAAGAARSGSHGLVAAAEGLQLALLIGAAE